MTLPDDWICPSRERCLCGSICEAREAMDITDEPAFFPGEAYTSRAYEPPFTPPVTAPPATPTPEPTDTEQTP